MSWNWNEEFWEYTYIYGRVKICRGSVQVDGFWEVWSSACDYSKANCWNFILYSYINWSQKWCFMVFYSILSVYSYLCCIELSTCPFIVWNSSDPKEKNSFDAFIMNNKVLSYCIHALVGNKWLQYGLDIVVLLLFGILRSEFLQPVNQVLGTDVKSTVVIVQPGENESPDKTDSQTHLSFTLTQIFSWNMRLPKVHNTQGVFS